MIERRIVRFFGRVQGVGFRYAVEALGQRHTRIAGSVFNERDHVTVDVEGEAADVDTFIDEILQSLPSGARVESKVAVVAPIRGHIGFAVGQTR
jgi:acylphosphatase